MLASLTVPERHGLNIGDLLRLAAVRRSGSEMLVCDGRRWTYAEANERVNRVATALRSLGVGEGDAVASVASNSDTLLFLYFALAKLGALNVPLNTMLRPRDISDAMNKSGARALVFGADFEHVEEVRSDALVDTPICIDGGSAADDRYIDLARCAADAEPSEVRTRVGGDDPATIIFTSGSTGTPKGCVKSHSNQIWSAVNCQLTIPRRPGDTELFAIPLSGIGFANFVLAAVLGGARIVLTTFEPEKCLRLIEDEGVTHGFLAGTMIAAMLEVPSSETYDTSTLKVLQTSYHLSERMRQRIADRFGPIVSYCGGSSEGSMSAATPDVFLSEPKCVGYPVGLDEYRVVDEDGRDVPPGIVGEILVSGPTVMQGYFGDAEGTRVAFDEAGWLRSGDLGRLDDRGRLHFEGRKRDMIKTGGMSVLAGEVELVIARLPAVREVAVIGVPDDRWGEAVRAVVVRAPGAPEDDGRFEQMLREHCRSELAGFKRPKDYVFVEELPKNPGGKIAKGVIVDLFAAAANRAAPSEHA